MEGSPFCPNCNIELVKTEKKVNVDLLNKGTLSGDVVLSEDGRTVLAAEDNENLSAEAAQTAHEKNFVSKSYSIRSEDMQEAEQLKKILETASFIEYTADDEEESEPPAPAPVPKWKIKQEKRRAKMNITSARAIGRYDDGQILPPGLSKNEFLMLLKMSPVRFCYFLAIVIVYISGGLSAAMNIIVGGWEYVLISVLIIEVLNLGIQFKQSEVCALILFGYSFIHCGILITFQRDIFSVTVVAAGILSVIGTFGYNKLYDNYVRTQTIPDKLSDVWKN